MNSNPCVIWVKFGGLRRFGYVDGIHIALLRSLVPSSADSTPSGANPLCVSAFKSLTPSDRFSTPFGNRTFDMEQRGIGIDKRSVQSGQHGKDPTKHAIDSFQPPVGSKRMDTGAVANNKRKRKREREKANKLVMTSSEVSGSPAEKMQQKSNLTAGEPRRKRKNQQPSKPESVDDTVALMDPMLVVDHIAQQLHKFSKMTAIELNDRLIPSYAILNTTSFVAERTLANLPDFVKQSTSAPSPRPLFLLRCTHPGPNWPAD